MSIKCTLALWSVLWVCLSAEAQQTMPSPIAATGRAIASGRQVHDQARNADSLPGHRRNRESTSPRRIALLHRQRLSRSRVLAARDTMTSPRPTPQVFRAQDTTAKIVTTIAGVTRTAYGNGGAATAAYLAYPGGVAVDAAGNFYIADSDNYQVRKVNVATGVISAVAGTGQFGYSGNGQLAVNAQIGYLSGLAVDAAGNLYLADQDYSVIRKVDGVTGIISVVAGVASQFGYSGDGGAATLANLGDPTSVAVDAAGNLYIADGDNYLIRKVSAATGIMTTVAGTPQGYGYSGDGGAATQAEIGYVQALAVDAAGNLYLADTDDSVIRVVAAATGIINTYAGNGGYADSGDGGLAINAGLGYPQGVAADGQGNLYIADVDNNSIRRVDGATKIITTVAGNGTSGFAGDGGPATQAEVAYPYGVAVDVNGDLYIADEGNNRIRQVNPSGTISSVAGNGLLAPTNNGALANTVPLSYPSGVAVDASGNVFFVDAEGNQIREVRAADGTLATVVGTGQNGYTGDGGPAASAALNYPQNIAFNQQGDLFIADGGNQVIRRVDHASGVITTVAGNGTYAYDNNGDGGPATSASLANPTALACDSTGNLYIAEQYPGYVRKVTPQGTISTVAGGGQYGSSNGDGGPATSAYLEYLSSIAVDAQGNIYIGDPNQRTVRKVSASTGIINTVIGNGQYGDSGDGGPALSASLGSVEALSFDAAGDLYIADYNTVRVVDTSGTIGTIAGQGGSGYSGDGGAVAFAEVSPVGVAVDSASNVYFTDSAGSRIRKVSAGAPQAAADSPVLSPGTGGYGASQSVTLADDTPGAQIFYTLDGSVPDPGISSLYSGPLSLVGAVMVQTIAIAPGYSTSDGVSASYTFPSPAPGAPFAPAFSPAAGAYTTAQSVTILDATAGATIYYTVDGSTPTASSYVYSGAITVNGSDTVRAMAVANGLSSPVSSNQYVITSPTATTLVSTANPGFLGANIVFTSTVTSTVAGIPTGTVSFSVDGGGGIVEVLNGAAQAVFPISSLGAGAHTVVASYSGDANFPASSSGTLNQTIQPGYLFVPATPCRVADTRGAAGTFAGPELGAGASREFDVPQSGCSIPSTAVAYSLNVTVLPNTTLTYLTMWPSGTAQPNVSTLNSFDGRVKANAAIVPAGLNGGVNIFASDASNVILDINGYFVPTGTASALAFYPLTPCRVADTRGDAGALAGPFLSGQTSRSFPVLSSPCGVPSTAQAYSLNLTTIPHSTLNYLTTWPSGQAQPNVSTLNAPTGAVTANAAIVPAGDSGAVSLFVSDDADVILDINGYFAAAGTGGLSLYPVTPCRLLDTRGASGAFQAVLQAAVETSGCTLPAAAQAYVLNATVVPPGPLNYLTLWPDSESQPNVSTLNANDAAITSNMAIVPTVNGQIDAFSSDPTQLILDISSYFAP